MRTEWTPEQISPVEPQEPDEEDAVLTNAGPLGAETALSFGGRYVGTFREESDAEECLARVMTAECFWPDVWTISDHGNACCISERFYADHPMT